MLLEVDKAFGSGVPSIGDVVRSFGGYWTDAHQTNDELAGIAHSFRNLARDGVRSINAFATGLDYTKIDTLRHVTYHPIHVNIEDIHNVAVKYGDGYSYGDSTDGQTLAYGDTRSDMWEIPVPSNLAKFASVMNKPGKADVFLVYGGQARFNEVNHTIELQCSDLFGKFPQTADGPPGTITLWLYMAGFDDNTAAKQYAGDIPLDLIRHDNVEAIRAVHDAAVNGPSEMSLRRFISGCTGSPIAIENETVEAILQQDNLEIVITDKRRYVGMPDDDAVVSAGDKLVAGDFLFDSVRFTDFENGEVPSWLNYIEFPRTYFGTRNSVYLQNLSVDVLYPDIGNGRVGVRFPVIIDPMDKNTFWDAFKQASEFALPSFVSRIAGSAGLPISDRWANNTGSLPTEVNILQTMAKVWLQYNLSLCQVRFSMVSERQRRLLRYVGLVVPPWISHIVQYVNEYGSIAVGRCRDVSMAHSSVNTYSSYASSIAYGEVIDNEGSCCAVDTSCGYLRPDGIFTYENLSADHFLRPEDICSPVYKIGHFLRPDGSRVVYRPDGTSFTLRPLEYWT